MANMSYCRFQNTILDLTDCTNFLGQTLDDEISYEDMINDMSGDEIRAMMQLRKEAKRFLKYFAELNGENND